jgi:hypothetical protein
MPGISEDKWKSNEQYKKGREKKLKKLKIIPVHNDPSHFPSVSILFFPCTTAKGL